ncbi:MAG: hypothetical protein WCF67_25335 [Chitinophagaceae bacterium]
MKQKVIKYRSELFGNEITLIVDKRLNKPITNPQYLKWQEEIMENLRRVEKMLPR